MRRKLSKAASMLEQWQPWPQHGEGEATVVNENREEAELHWPAFLRKRKGHLMPVVEAEESHEAPLFDLWRCSGSYLHRRSAALAEAKMVDKGSKGRKEEVVTREYTINLHKRLHG
ncbi:hypothetical protein ZIOFF_040416 [Zingiber officinale]|uniref:Uncharacterized protein n=1 Tax=Zingiber officinale TaxID=94328 RepID=A0A8J5G3X7_ZINOF|nr:hypothetical protein ZIOFF_040416 [Zingiber officinale]